VPGASSATVTQGYEALPFETTAASDLIQVAVDIDLQQVARVIGLATGGFGLGLGESQLLEVQPFYEGLNTLTGLS
jgi:hypothetical protein